MLPFALQRSQRNRSLMTIFSTEQKQSLYLATMGMMYVCLMLTSAVLTHKVIIIGPSITLAGALVMPIMFVLSDMITEIYDYRIAAYMVSFAFICQLTFAAICTGLIHAPSPSFWQGQSAYDFVLGSQLRIGICSCVAYFISSTLNVYIISKSKKLWHGHFFWLRSIGASTIGEFIFTVLAVVSMQYGKVPWDAILKIIITSYTIKVIGTLIGVTPASLIVKQIKKSLTYSAHTSIPKTLTPFVVKGAI
jgi:queuosine precursor transporter